MKRSIFIKIFVGNLLLICLLSAALFFVSFRVIKQAHLETLTGELEKLGESLKVSCVPYLEQGRTRELDVFVKQMGRVIQSRITIIDSHGTVLADSENDPLVMENHKARPEMLQALYGDVGTSTRFSTTVKESMLYVALPVRNGERVAWVIRVSLFLSTIKGFLRELQYTIIQIALFIIGIALIGSYIAARRFSDPIRKLSEASHRVADGDFDARVFLENKDELHDLANSFNAMTEKIRGLFAEVSQQQEELNNIISFMHEGLLVLDSNDRVLIANERFKALTDCEPRQGAFYWEMLRDPLFGSVIKQARRGQSNVIEEISLDDKNFVCSVSLLPAKGEIVIVLLDVSEIRNVERIKKDFVVNVSHELRTPLTAIKGFIETMLEDVQDQEHKRYLDIIKRHTDRLINIVKDLMTLSSLEKQTTLETEEVYLGELIEQTRKVYDQRLKEKGLNLRIEIDDMHVPLKADPFKLEQVFINLIDNAIKYTEQGDISVTVTHEQKHATIVIEDTGIGMPDSDHAKIFERFYVVDKSRSRKVGGTGLGLSIVKHIILLHKGTITVKSTPGVGTAFTIHLPIV